MHCEVTFHTQVCYTWWCLSALSILGRLHWIDQAALQSFILDCQVSSNASCCALDTCVLGTSACNNVVVSCTLCTGMQAAVRCIALPTYVYAKQDAEDGGISDRPEDVTDVYHTFFGIAGLSLMGFGGLQPVDPTFALPSTVVQSLRHARLETQ